MVIPALVGQALRGQPLTVYGDGQQSRCFCDVRDVVEGLVGLVAHPAAAGRVFNLGSTEEITILELARRIVQRTGSRSEIVFVPYDQAYAPGFEDMRRRVPDITRIRELIGWQPRRTLDEILDAVIEDQRRQVEARAG
jgi:UDP-glucose 4-epimerase